MDLRVADGTMCNASPYSVCRSGRCEFAPESVFKWHATEWNACSATCGGGVQNRTVSCMERTSSGETIQADPSQCSHLPPPPVSVQKCAHKLCVTYAWHVRPWFRCNRDCGTGTQLRDVSCMGSNGVKASFVNCRKEGPMPEFERACNTQKCLTYDWKVSPFTECSKTCGGGTRTRTVECKADDGSTPSSDGVCTKVRPVSMTSCNSQVCVGYSYYKSAWSACNKECDGGVSTRTTFCTSDLMRSPVDAATFCANVTRPATTRACNTKACTHYYWSEGKFWTKCTKRCGSGIQQRHVWCRRDSDDSVVDNSMCMGDSKAGTMPPSSRLCNTQACAMRLKKAQHFWDVDNAWSSCSKKCGGGTQNRAIRCISERTRKPAAFDRCVSTDAGPQPLSQQACNSQPCSGAPVSFREVSHSVQHSSTAPPHPAAAAAIPIVKSWEHHDSVPHHSVGLVADHFRFVELDRAPPKHSLGPI